MSLKDNFNQAVKEILKKDGLVGEDSPKAPKESKKKSELDKYLETPPPAEAQPESSFPEEDSDFEQSPYTAPNVQSFGRPVTPEPEPMVYNEPAVEPAPYEPVQNTDNFNASAGTASYGTAPPPRMSPPPPPPPPPPQRQAAFPGRQSDTPYYETEETTIISRNTVIDGNIRSFANINIDGSVKGDVRITKNINITGKVVGDIECNNSTMNGASMQGNVSSKGQVQVDRDSLLLGDIIAQYLDLNGKIKGNIDVGGKAEFKADAIILGNITASTITVLDGATIQGYVNTTFLQESSSSIFPEAIAVSE